MADRVQHSWPEIKAKADSSIAHWGLFLLVILTGLAAFGLGRLSTQDGAKASISVTQAPQGVAPRALAVGGLYVASKSGTVYYYPWCTGAEKILPQNARWFADELSAQSAGYAPSKSCKGLGGE